MPPRSSGTLRNDGPTVVEIAFAVSIESSEALSEELKLAKIKHVVLNAKHHEKEAEIVSQAGDMVVDLGTYDYQGLDPKQKPVQDVGKYVSVYKQVDGQWKMVVDAWNSDPAPAKPGK